MVVLVVIAGVHPTVLLKMIAALMRSFFAEFANLGTAIFAEFVSMTMTLSKMKFYVCEKRRANKTTQLAAIASMRNKININAYLTAPCPWGHNCYMYMGTIIGNMATISKKRFPIMHMLSLLLVSSVRLRL